jgi:molybdenum cofactor cytidylyltransferase
MCSVAIVPSAGKGERFGGAKLTTTIGGETLLDRTLSSLLAGGVGRIVVVIAPGAGLECVQRLADSRVHVVVNDDPSRGMFSSIQTGLRVAGGDPVLILPGDMPFVSAATVAAVASACVREQAIVVPTHGGRRGHPIAFPAAVQAAVLNTPVTSILKDALAASGAARFELPVDDPGILRDVDVPADLGSDPPDVHLA